MLATQTDVFSVPAKKKTILTVRETGATFRTFVFTNVKAADLTVAIEESADGVKWSVAEPPFTVGAAGSETANMVKIVESPNMLRIRAAGGKNGQELELGYTRLKDSQRRIWA